NRDALLGLAAIDVRAGRYEPAEAIYLRLLQSDPRDSHAHAALIELRAGRMDPLAAESRVKSLLANDPAADVLYFTLGNQLALQGRWAEARQYYSKAFAADPDNADFAYNLAVSLDHLREPKLALEYYARALALAEKRAASFELATARSRVQQLGLVSEATLRDALSEKLGLQSVDLGRIIVDPAALKTLPRDMARRYRVFPVALDRQQKKFIVALSDTNNIVAIDQLRAHLKGEFEVELRLAGDTEIERAIEHYYGHEFSIDGILKEIETGELDYATIVEGDEYSQPVVRLISALLADAVERVASDIHFEPEQNFLRIRYRIDGVLRQIRSLHKTYWPAMAVRLKVMAKMNIAETRAPQDGRISATMSGRVVDFRVASLPTTHGENLVLRILDRQKGIVPLDKLNLDEPQLELLKRMIARPEGIILVTGPTGSGKTTTLYSILNHINSDGVNIMTLEDPVEYPMTLIRQTSVSEAAKLDF